MVKHLFLRFLTSRVFNCLNLVTTFFIFLFLLLLSHSLLGPFFSSSFLSTVLGGHDTPSLARRPTYVVVGFLPFTTPSPVQKRLTCVLSGCFVRILLKALYDHHCHDCRIPIVQYLGKLKRNVRRECAQRVDPFYQARTTYIWTSRHT